MPHNLQLQSDRLFGNVLSCAEVRAAGAAPPCCAALATAAPPAVCTQERQSYLTIPGLTYGAGGPFAVALWFQVGRNPAGKGARRPWK